MGIFYLICGGTITITCILIKFSNMKLDQLRLEKEIAELKLHINEQGKTNLYVLQGVLDRLKMFNGTQNPKEITTRIMSQEEYNSLASLSNPIDILFGVLELSSIKMDKVNISRLQKTRDVLESLKHEDNS